MATKRSHFGLFRSRSITREGLYIRPIRCAAYWLPQIGAGVKLTFHDQFFMVVVDTVYLQLPGVTECLLVGELLPECYVLLPVR